MMQIFETEERYDIVKEDFLSVQLLEIIRLLITPCCHIQGIYSVQILTVLEDYLSEK